jgi:hypothetical protein
MEFSELQKCKTPLERAGSANLLGVERRFRMNLLMLLLFLLLRKRRIKLKFNIELLPNPKGSGRSELLLPSASIINIILG